jgi:hypothetical protein
MPTEYRQHVLSHQGVEDRVALGRVPARFFGNDEIVCVVDFAQALTGWTLRAVIAITESDARRALALLGNGAHAALRCTRAGTLGVS